MNKKIFFLLLLICMTGLPFNRVTFSDENKKKAASPEINHDEKTSRERDHDKTSTKEVAEDLVLSEPLIYFPEGS